jgi:hypothetical protein
VAAGLHAWLEWPVLAMALLGAARVTPIACLRPR